jgi:hypothetical protein
MSCDESLHPQPSQVDVDSRQRISWKRFSV